MRTRRLFLSAITLSALSLAVLLLHAHRASSQDVNTPSTEIRVDNFTFAPGTLTVPVGASVTWINKDDVPHVIASTDGVFKSKGLDTDDHYSYRFTKAGTYNYFCSIHPKMTGKILVQ
jgi:plastocyanin